MSNFNKELINKVQLFNNEELEESYELKYSFLKFVISNLESISPEDIEICNEEFEDLNSNIDAFYYDEDSQLYNLYISIFDGNNCDYILDNESVSKEYTKIVNFIKNSISGKFIIYDDCSFTYQIANDIHKNLKNIEIVVNIVSNYKIPSSYKKDNIETIDNYNVSFRTYDLEDLENKFKQLTSSSIELNVYETFKSNIDAIKISSNPDFDVYLFSMRGDWLALLYKEDSARLLEQNVRSYLKRTSKTNSGILETVKSNPENFVSYNNGISAVCTNITVDRKNSILNLVRLVTISNFQIVNGGQTTATLFECYKDKLTNELNEVIVPVKLTVVKNVGNSDSLIRNISVYSNTQTAIKKSDPPSNLPYYICIKKLSTSVLSDNSDGLKYCCYFERTNGEYDTELRRNNSSKKFCNTNPKDKKFDKIDLARAINCWEQLPFVSCQGKEKNFSFFNETVKNQLFDPDESYFKSAYSCVILYKKIDKLAKKMNLTCKSNVVSYSLSFLSFLYDKKINFEEIWIQKDIPTYLIDVLYDVMPKIHNIILNAPSDCPEPRMWARKERCWDEIKEKVKCGIIIKKYSQLTNFYRSNEALVYISNDSNFYNSSTWINLLLWDNKFKILSKNQISIVKMMRQNADDESIQLTKKQIDFLKEIFVNSVKNGFKYNK